jgi:hypothetical protein
MNMAESAGPWLLIPPFRHIVMMVAPTNVANWAKGQLTLFPFKSLSYAALT